MKLPPGEGAGRAHSVGTTSLAFISVSAFGRCPQELSWRITAALPAHGGGNGAWRPPVETGAVLHRGSLSS